VRDLTQQIERREKQNSALADDLTKARDKISNLLSTIDELQSTDSVNQLSAKRAERELREEKERALRLERELEGWKGLRFERGSMVGSVRGRREGSVVLVPPSVVGGENARPVSRRVTPKTEGAADASTGAAAGVPARPLRRVSHTKGFL